MFVDVFLKANPPTNQQLNEATNKGNIVRLQKRKIHVRSINGSSCFVRLKFLHLHVSTELKHILSWVNDTSPQIVRPSLSFVSLTKPPHMLFQHEGTCGLKRDMVYPGFDWFFTKEKPNVSLTPVKISMSPEKGPFQ